MKRAIKATLIMVSLLVVLSIFSLSILAKFHHTTAHKELLEQLNSELNGVVKIGDFNYSYLKKFPKVHIEVNDIVITDSNNNVSKVEKLDILLNLKSLWNSKLEIERLIIQGAYFQSVIDSLGHKPQLFAKKSASSKPNEEDSGLIIESHDIELYDCQIHLGNLYKKNHLIIGINEGILGLSVNDSSINISGTVLAKLDTLIANDNLLFDNLPAVVKNLSFNINRNTGEKKLMEGIIVANKLELTPLISFKPFEDGQLIDLQISSANNIDAFLEIMGSKIGLDLEQVNPDAKLAIVYKLKGFVNPTQFPYFELDFQIENAEIISSKVPFPIKNVYVSGNFNNGGSRNPETSEIVIDTVHAEINDSFINARFKLLNTADPFVDAHLVTSLNLSNLIEKNDTLEISGFLDADFIVKGKISELRKFHFENKQMASGNLTISNLKLKQKRDKVDLLLSSGQLTFKNHQFEIDNLQGVMNQTAFALNGKFENVDQYILEPNARLIGDADFRFDKLKLSDISSQGTNKTNSVSQSINLPKVDVNLSIHGQKIESEFGDITNLEFNTSLNDSSLSLNSFSFYYQEGKVNGDASMFIKNQQIDSLAINLSGDFKKMSFDHISNSNNSASVSSSLEIPTYLHLSLDLQVDELEIQSVPITNLEIDLKVNKSTISIDKLNLDVFGGKSRIYGKVLFEGDKISEIAATSILELDELNIDEILKSKAFEKKSNSGKTNSSLELPSIFNIDLKATCNQFTYENVAIENVDLDIDLSDKFLALKKLNFDFLNGQIDINGKLTLGEPDGYPAILFTNGKEIDIQQGLSSFDNFGQHVFNSDNSSGAISWDSEHYFNLDSLFNLTMDDHLGSLNLSIHDAELIDIKPIEKVLFFIDHKAKDDFLVKELQINSLIDGNTVLFKDVYMNDNIVNMGMFGEVDLSDSLLNIGVEVSLSDLFFRSKKKRVVETQEGRIDLDKDMKLYLQMHGPISQHKIKKSNGKKFRKEREALSKDKDQIENALLEARKKSNK